MIFVRVAASPVPSTWAIAAGGQNTKMAEIQDNLDPLIHRPPGNVIVETRGKIWYNNNSSNLLDTFFCVWQNRQCYICNSAAKCWTKRINRPIHSTVVLERFGKRVDPPPVPAAGPIKYSRRLLKWNLDAKTLRLAPPAPRRCQSLCILFQVCVYLTVCYKIKGFLCPCLHPLSRSTRNDIMLPSSSRDIV